MKTKLFFLCFVFAGLALLFAPRHQSSDKTVNNTLLPTHAPSPPETTHDQQNSIFVPYWVSGINEKTETAYTFYYYFGVRPTRDGSIENEPGYEGLSRMKSIPEKRKKLVLRLLDPSITEVLLEDETVRKKFILEVEKNLSQNAFSGAILDLEVPFTLNQNKREQITQFVQQMCTALKTDYKTCSVLVYGDFAYRNRPYDLKKIGEIADSILLMAYDFHTSAGEPGPNFSFEEKKTYGYDFKTMVKDAISLLPKEKIEVVFGMYGYDWTLNQQGTPIKPAKALTLKEIQTQNSNSKLLPVTDYEIHSNDALEKEITYVDAEKRTHSVWYEDEESVGVKTKYLQNVGIDKVSYWAYGYF